MDLHRPASSALTIVIVGAVALASAMGVGRFAFTPLFPLMQAHDGLALGQGAWLASANYLGYAIGALGCSLRPPPPHAAARFGLVAVALSTLAMGATADYPAWLALRFAAGAASAYVLVGVSAWAITALGERGRSGWSGGVFAGVGVGIALAGGAALAAGVVGSEPAYVWMGLGAISATAAAAAWRLLRADAASPLAGPAASSRPSACAWRLIAGYGAFGFGYIIPATFLPAMAREAIADPAIFGWVWPAFGATAAVSTALVALLLPRVPPARLWAASLFVMAVGVLAPALRPGIASLLVAAVCVGGTFMVATLAGMQQARRVAGVGAPHLMAAMTAAFALGQLSGPVVVALATASGADGIAGPSVLGAVCLLAAAFSMRGTLAAPSATLRKQGIRT